MEMRCERCKAPVSAGQPFCSKCGAVVGMSDAGPRRGEGWDMADTVVGKNQPATPRPKSPADARSPRTAQARSSVKPPPATPARGGNTMLLAVIGFVAVLLIGGLLVLLFYLNSQG